MKNKTKYSSILLELKNLLRDDTKSCLSIEYLEEKLFNKFKDEKNIASETNSSNFPIPKFEGTNEHSYYLYSDGACRGNPGPGAWGCLVQDYKGEVVYEDANHLNPTTNNQMELEGAIKALEYIYKEISSKNGMDILKINIHLFSDSKYVIDGLKSWMDGWKKRGWKKADRKPPENLDYWKRLDELKTKIKNIKYYWVKGHAGHPQNEHCDFLANRSLDRNGF